jgi:hypothetical protein
MQETFAALLAEQDAWVARLSHPVAAGNEISTFDLLVKVSRQVPAWLSLKQREYFRSHPFLITALFISGASTAYTALLTLANLEDSSLVYLPIVLAPLVALFIASALAEVSALIRDREATLARWSVEASRLAVEESLVESL